MKEPVKFANLTVSELFVMKRPPSEDLVPVRRSWHKRFMDWLLRRPAPLTSERKMLDDYTTARHKDPSTPSSVAPQPAATQQSGDGTERQLLVLAHATIAAAKEIRCYPEGPIGFDEFQEALDAYEALLFEHEACDCRCHDPTTPTDFRGGCASARCCEFQFRLREGEKGAPVSPEKTTLFRGLGSEPCLNCDKPLAEHGLVPFYCPRQEGAQPKEGEK